MASEARQGQGYHWGHIEDVLFLEPSAGYTRVYNNDCLFLVILKMSCGNLKDQTRQNLTTYRFP